MQAVILCAGKSTRTYPLTLTKPKPLLKVGNTTIIERNLEELQGLVDEVLLVVGYKKELIQEYLGDTFGSVKITYVIQEDQNGTGGALFQVKDMIDDSFLVMNGDDLFAKNDIKKCLRHVSCILVKEVEDLYRFGEVMGGNGIVERIIEKPGAKKGLANTGLYFFPKDIFEYELKKSERGEFEIIDYVNFLDDVKYEIVEEYWLPITYPWNILDANEQLLKRTKKSIEGEVEEFVTINGEVSVGKGTIIKSGAYIEGPVIIGDNCIIGPNCHIRQGTVIGNGSKVGNGVDIKNATIGENTSIAHLAYIGDSVLGDNVNIAAGVVTANLRHDKQSIKSPVKGELIDTGRRKLGSIIADGAKLGIHTSIYPGRKIWPGVMTLPGSIVEKDIENEK